MRYSLSDITNTLEYKLGKAILRKKILGGGGDSHYYIDTNIVKLLFKLRITKLLHVRQQKFYKKIIYFFPQYEKEPVIINDPHELIKPFGIKVSLTYRLGKIIKNNRTRWYKGGFYQSIQEAKKELAVFYRAKILQETIQNIYTQSYSNNKK